jgi:hypothetical protein
MVQMVSRFRERNVGTRGSLAVHATYNHVTTRVLYIILRDRVKKVYPNLEYNSILCSLLPNSRIFGNSNKETQPSQAGGYIPALVISWGAQKSMHKPQWSGFKLFFFRHGGAMAWRGWPSVFQDSMRLAVG